MSSIASFYLNLQIHSHPLSLSSTLDKFPQGRMEIFICSQIKNSLPESQGRWTQGSLPTSSFHHPQSISLCPPLSPLELAVSLSRAWFSCIFIVCDLVGLMYAHSFTNLFMDFQNYIDITFPDKESMAPMKTNFLWYLEISLFVLNDLQFLIIIQY